MVNCINLEYPLGLYPPVPALFYNIAEMRALFTQKNFFTALAVIPLVVFLRVARHYGLTDDAWMRAFVTGAALSLLVLALSFFRRAPLRDILLASSLLLVSGGAAFLADFRPVIDFYKRFQGSVFIAWYLGLRLLLLFYPGLAGYVRDPYAKVPKLAAGLTAAVLVWSLFHSDLVVSTVIPVTLLSVFLSLAARRSGPSAA